MIHMYVVLYYLIIGFVTCSFCEKFIQSQAVICAVLRWEEFKKYSKIERTSYNTTHPNQFQVIMVSTIVWFPIFLSYFFILVLIYKNRLKKYSDDKREAKVKTLINSITTISETIKKQQEQN